MAELMPGSAEAGGMPRGDLPREGEPRSSSEIVRRGAGGRWLDEWELQNERMAIIRQFIEGWKQDRGFQVDQLDPTRPAVRIPYRSPNPALSEPAAPMPRVEPVPYRPRRRAIDG